VPTHHSRFEWSGDVPVPLSLDEVRAVAADAVAPRHFFVGNGLELEWEHAPAESIPWEIYKGRLLDASQTRERQTFEAWNIWAIDETGRSTEPLLSVKLDGETGQLHVVRAILCYAWEAYDAGDNVILSRETTKWVRELVGTIEPVNCIINQDLTREIVARLHQGVIGTSRLPLASLEAPLPAFSFGRLAYFYGREPGTGPLRTWRDLIRRAFSSKDALLHSGKAKLLEFLLRAVPWSEFAPMVDEFAIHFRAREHKAFVEVDAREPESADAGRADLKAMASDPLLVARRSLPPLLCEVFNDAALTPYTDLVDRALLFAESLKSQGHLLASDVANSFAQILCQLGRHLSAYDLVTFHNRGANYPDALVLDALLKAYLGLIQREPDSFLSSPSNDEFTRRLKRLRRRGLRQGWLLRRCYEGHLVPDAPTSPGENLRVLPAPYARVPDEQIFNPALRTKRLYMDDPLDKHLGERAREVLLQSIADLQHPNELRELGMAIFLDRPLGAGKGLTEPDDTLLFSYLAFSRSIARNRLDYMSNELGLLGDSTILEGLRHQLAGLEVKGIPIKDNVDCSRQAIVSLADALRTADDFVLLRTTGRPWFRFACGYLLNASSNAFALKGLSVTNPELCFRRIAPGDGQVILMIYDSELRPRMLLSFDPSKGYMTRRGVGYPVSPLSVLRVWEEAEEGKPLRERDLSGERVLLGPPLV
jgi:hypothetical protein